MPSSPRKTKRVPRCVYRERGRQCIRNASGQGGPIPLCTVHTVVLKDVGRPSPRTDSAIGAIVEDLMSGQRVSKDRLREAAAEIAGIFGGGAMGHDYRPPEPGFHNPPPPTGQWWDPITAGVREAHRARQQQRQRPTEEEILENEREDLRKRARVILGFAASEAAPREVIVKRYRELARKNHPDRFQGEVQKKAATEKMMAINAANDILMADFQ